MSRRKTPIEVALASASAPTMKRMEADEEKVSPKLKPFARYLRENLFSQGLTVRKARRKTGNRDNSLSASFRRYLGTTPWPYIRLARLEVADVLLRDYAYTVGEVAEAVGYDNDTTFSRNYEALTGDKPSAVIGQGSTPDIGIATWRRALRGELEPEEGLKVLARLRQLYEGRTALPPGFADGPEYERWKAEELWEEIRPLSFERQRSVVRWHPFRTTALFDHLRRKSREEGRKDRQLGVRLAELAVVSLDACGEASTDRFHDRVAEGLATLGRARRVAFDFAAADADFTDAWTTWQTPRANPEQRVAAQICLHQGTLRMFQRKYDEALELLEDSLAHAREAGDRAVETQALIQRAAVNGYMERLQEETSDLEKALVLTEELEDDFLRFAVEFNMVAAKSRRGNFQAATEDHRLLKCKYKLRDYPKGRSEIEHLEGNISEGMGDHGKAEAHYVTAYQQFVQLKEWRGAAFAGLDLAIVRWHQRQHQEVLRLLSDLIPVLQSFRLHPEALAAVGLLAESLADKEITHALLIRVRKELQRDPLVELS